jgi:ribosomal protein L20A (L18A)
VTNSGVTSIVAGSNVTVSGATGAVTVKVPKTKTSHADKPHDVSDSVWSDFVLHRKAKRAAITKTAIDGIEAEAKKAGITLQQALEHCCLSGWQGFRADWYLNQTKSGNINKQEALEARNQSVSDEFIRNLQ